MPRLGSPRLEDEKLVDRRRVPVAPDADEFDVLDRSWDAVEDETVGDLLAGMPDRSGNPAAGLRECR